MATKKKTLRERDADRMRRNIAAALHEVERLTSIWGCWADSVRQGAEARQGMDDDGNLRQADPEHSRALDAMAPLERARLALLEAEACFAETEAMAGAAKSAEHEPQPEPEAEP
jgi:hypothetical protein